MFGVKEKMEKGKKVVVVGGVTGGASFTARLRRLDEQAEIIMFDKRNYISFVNCGLPYHIGDIIKDHDDLIIQTPDKFRAQLNIDVRITSEVAGIDTRKKTVAVRSTAGEYTESYDVLLLTPGSRPVRPPPVLIVTQRTGPAFLNPAPGFTH
jgi:NADPH-dependent 2,4-dienoyl-CoA reductase/sulfur reductase-like enzyme